jgi:hypothetical protein
MPPGMRIDMFPLRPGDNALSPPFHDRTSRANGAVLMLQARLPVFGQMHRLHDGASRPGSLLALRKQPLQPVAGRAAHTPLRDQPGDKARRGHVKGRVGRLASW